VNGAGAKLRRAVEASTPALEAITDASAARPLSPGKWSRKEVLGHLIDSAANNHQRFVRARFQEDLVFPGYAQDEWVRSQNYAAAPWAELVGLWQLYNLHLARVIDGIPEEVLRRERRRHSFDRIAFRKVPAESPATLEYLAHDYVAHLEHHLAQVLPKAGDREGGG
jgi:hypothetical protein